jgi:hypothetical protein
MSCIWTKRTGYMASKFMSTQPSKQRRRHLHTHVSPKSSEHLVFASKIEPKLIVKGHVRLFLRSLPSATTSYNRSISRDTSQGPTPAHEPQKETADILWPTNPWVVPLHGARRANCTAGRNVRMEYVTVSRNPHIFPAGSNRCRSLEMWRWGKEESGHVVGVVWRGRLLLHGCA